MTMEKHYQPPGLGAWLLERTRYRADGDILLGDLEEEYQLWCRHRGKRQARRWYWRQVVTSLPVFILQSIYWGTVMLKNQLKTVLRTLRSQKGYAILNVAGLSVGIALSILALLYVQHEYSFDGSFSKSDRIYRVVQDINLPYAEISVGTVGGGLAERLLENFPEVIQATIIFGGQRDYTLKYGNKLFKVKNRYGVDPSIFDLFDIEIVRGNAQEPFPDYESFVISETTARKVFGEEDPIGEMITLTGPFLDTYDMTVTAVARDMPVNSHFQFDYLDWLEPGEPGSRTGQVADWQEGFFTYIVLPEDYAPERLETKFPAFVDAFIGPEVEEWVWMGGSSWEEIKKAGGSWTLHLQALKDIHWDTQYEAFERQGSQTSINLFSLIAFFILALACVNFMNLATARSSRRLKEVGVRKVVGSSRTQLIHQFLLESIIVSMLSLLLACALVVLLLPAFNAFLGTEITFGLFENAYILPGLIILAGAVGILAGSYPAFFLSAFRPIELLSGARRSGRRGVSLRDGLVVFQFLITVLLIVATLVVYRQLSFMRDKDLGFDGEHVLVLQDVKSAFLRTEAPSYRGLLEESGSSWQEWQSLSPRQQNDMVEASDGALGHYNAITWRRMRVFKQRLLEIPGVQSVSISQAIPGRYSESRVVVPPAVLLKEDAVEIRWFAIDGDFLETLQLELVAGRNASNDGLPIAMRSFLINETAAELFGTDYPVGSTVADLLLKIAGNGYQPPWYSKRPIVGVVKDFLYADMHTEIQPTIFHGGIPNRVSSHVIVRLQSSDLQATLASIESAWSEFIPDEALSYSFLDEDFARLFEAENRLGKAIGFFATLAIMVACLGLFGLATFMAEQRTKEIGIRKTLGASVRNIVQLLSRHFLWLLLIGNLVAWPIGYIVMNRWLENFAFRIDIGADIFILTGAVALLLVVIAVGGQALRASLANPVESLRYE